MTQTEMLLAALNPEPSYSIDPSDSSPPAYVDWSTRDDDDPRKLIVEVGLATGEAVQLPMTRDELLGLQQALTGWLAANPE